jgi:D-mannonate dehydratase
MEILPLALIIVIISLGVIYRKSNNRSIDDGRTLTSSPIENKNYNDQILYELINMNKSISKIEKNVKFFAWLTIVSMVVYAFVALAVNF